MKFCNLRTAMTILRAIRIIKSVSGRRNGASRSRQMQGGVPETAFSKLTARLLWRCDPSAERLRRRHLYGLCGEWLATDDRCQAVFATLPQEVVPYGYPFYFRGGDVESFQAELFDKGMICLRWPDHLPSMSNEVPSHYKNLLYISFLW
jgi:hypothetical protein